MRRIRLGWIGLTNGLWFLAAAYFLLPVLRGSPWLLPLTMITLAWEYLVGAALGFALEIVQAKSAKLVNVGMWVWFALRNTARYFSVWGQFHSNRSLATYVIGLAWTIVVVDIFLYGWERNRQHIPPRVAY